MDCPHNQILSETYLEDILFRQTPSFKKKNQIFRVDSGMLSVVSLGISEGETVPTTLFRYKHYIFFKESKILRDSSFQNTGCVSDEEWLTWSGASSLSLKEVVCFTIIVKVIMANY